VAVVVVVDHKLPEIADVIHDTVAKNGFANDLPKPVIGAFAVHFLTHQSRARQIVYEG